VSKTNARVLFILSSRTDFLSFLFVCVSCSDFGSASIKVWQVVMTMKGESRDVQEAVYSNIMHGGWNPPPVKPLITINYLDGVAKIGSSKASRKAESAR
jgi:hypothetical protein